MIITAETRKELSKKVKAIIKACNQAHKATGKSKLVFK